MFFLRFIALCLIAVLIMTAIEKGLRKAFKIGKRDKKRPKYLNNIHKWGEIALLIAFVISFLSLGNLFTESNLMYVWIIFFFMLQGLFRAFMEWKFAVQQREYIIHLFGVFAFLVIIAIALNTNWLERIFGL